MGFPKRGSPDQALLIGASKNGAKSEGHPMDR